MMKHNDHKRYRKGQLFTIDAAIALSGLLFVIGAIFFVNEYSQKKIDISNQLNSLQRTNIFSSQEMITSSGNPTNWSLISNGSFNSTTISYLGLAKGDTYNNQDVSNKGTSYALNTFGPFNIDISKVTRLAELNSTKYLDIKEILGIMGQGEEYELKIYLFNGTGFSLSYDFGIPPPKNATHITRNARYMTDGSAIFKVISLVWQRCYELC